MSYGQRRPLPSASIGTIERDRRGHHHETSERMLVTGGAGFIGSHLVEALLGARFRGSRRRQPCHGAPLEPGAS